MLPIYSFEVQGGTNKMKQSYGPDGALFVPIIVLDYTET